jgi:long-subunit fatty acid transport protein
VEGDITDAWILFGGVSYSTSPVPTATLEPGFPRGDTLALGLGFTYAVERLTIDVGYSYQVSSDRKATGQELENPDLPSTYSNIAQVFGLSARWSW